MSTRPVFDFRGIEDVGGATSLDDVRDLLRGSEPATLLAPGTIGTQTAGQGAGLPMDRIRRGLLGPLRGRTTGNYSITSTSFTDLDALNLAGVLVCSGRPVRIDLSLGANRGTSTGVIFSAALDGVEVTSRYNGMAWNYNTTDEWLSGFFVTTPRPGPRRFSLVAKTDTGTGGTVYATNLDTVTFLVCEL